MNAEQVVAAGGVVPAKSSVKTEIPLDPVAARQWSHPGLAEPVVLVDLTALAPARDLEMEFLGFEAPSDLGSVGKQPRRALGFPGSAIVSDPDNAKFALEVVKEFRKAARRAQSKPGHAKTAIDDIGKRLGMSVPHFLPSYYEEACRMFLEAGNKSYAGQMFEKAREAERVHALEVDETLRENTFVEFALAGALAIKSLTNYAKELASSSEPDEAYATFRRVCIKRTLGGLPPWAKMATELKRLAKAAKLDVTAEEKAVLAEIIDAPSLAKTVKGFWKPYTKSLVALAKEQPAIRRQLLELFPNVDPPEWIEILDKCDAFDGAVDPDAPDEVKPGGRIGAWFERLAKFASGYSDPMPDRAFELLEQAAPILREEGQPLNLFGRWEDGDLDFVERAFQLELPMAEPPDNARLSQPNEWAKRAGEPCRGLDPIGIAGDARYAPLLDQAINNTLGSEPFTTAALERGGFTGAIGKWLATKLDAVESGGAMPALFDTLKSLAQRATGNVWTAFPEQLARLEKASVAPALIESLRIGIFDEIGWKALDEVIDAIGADTEVHISGVFPNVIVYDKVSATVVGPRGVIAKHDVALPQGARYEGCRYAQDQLMVIYRDSSYTSMGTWSGNPDEHFEIEGSVYSYGDGGFVGVVLEDGSVMGSTRAFCAGDRWVPRDSAISDGETFWRQEGDYQNRHLREVDPRTGKLGRKSKPEFFESYTREGMQLNDYSCWLTCLPDGVTGSVLGDKDGLVGMRTRFRDSESPLADSVPYMEIERTDGATWTEVERVRHNIPEALVTFPGDDRPRPVFSGWRSVSIAGPGDWMIGSNTNQHYRRGTRSLMPIRWWGAFEPRDPKGSEALRQITAEQAEALIAAGVAARESAERDDKGNIVFGFEGTDLAAAIETIFDGAITDPRLARGVGGFAWMAAGDAERLTRLIKSSTEAASEAGSKLADDPPALASALTGLGSFGTPSKGIAEIGAVAALFDELEDGEVRTFEEGSSSDWEYLIGSRAALAYRCVIDSTTDEQRSALLSLLDAFAASSFAGRVRETRMIETEKVPEVARLGKRIFGFRAGSSRYFGWSSYRETATLLEWAEGGEFALPEGAGALTDDKRPTSEWGTADQIAALRARLESDGPIDIEPLVDGFAAATNHTRTEALMVLCGMCDQNTEVLSRRFPKLKSRLIDLAKSGATADRDKRTAVLSDAVTADPNAAWDDPEGFAASLAAAWNEHLDDMVPISEEVAEEMVVAKVTDNPTWAMRTIGRPDANHLSIDGEWAINENNQVRCATEGTYFSTGTLATVTPLIPYLALYAPVGDPVRSKIPEALAAIRERLTNPKMWVEIADVSFYGDDGDARREAFIDGFGGEPLSGPKGEIPEARQKPGFMMIPGRYGIEIHVNPSMFRDQADEVAKYRFMQGWTPAWVTCLDAVYGEAFDRLAARIAETPVEAGAFEGNPIASVPELVEKVGGALDLDQNAAALYLQLAALPAPKDKLIKAWNGWSAKVHKAAIKKLVDRELVIEAKRSRAGRSVFVHGGWEALKSPLCPIETWKLPLYGIERNSEGGLIVPFSEILPLEPIHTVFEKTWARIESGDKPSYEEPGK